MAKRKGHQFWLAALSLLSLALSHSLSYRLPRRFSSQLFQPRRLARARELASGLFVRLSGFTQFALSLLQCLPGFLQSALGLPLSPLGLLLLLRSIVYSRTKAQESQYHGHEGDHQALPQFPIDNTRYVLCWHRCLPPR